MFQGMASINKWSFGFFGLYVTDLEMDIDPFAIKSRIFNCWYKNIPVMRYSTILYIAVQCRKTQNYVIEQLLFEFIKYIN